MGRSERLGQNMGWGQDCSYGSSSGIARVWFKGGAQSISTGTPGTPLPSSRLIKSRVVSSAAAMTERKRVKSGLRTTSVPAGGTPVLQHCQTDSEPGPRAILVQCA